MVATLPSSSSPLLPQLRLPSDSFRGHPAVARGAEDDGILDGRDNERRQPLGSLGRMTTPDEPSLYGGLPQALSVFADFAGAFVRGDGLQGDGGDTALLSESCRPDVVSHPQHALSDGFA